MGIVVELDLTGDLSEEPPSNPLEWALARNRTVLPVIVKKLDDAAGDRRVTGLWAKVGSARLSLAHAQDLAEAVARFRQSGKPAIAWAETFGELVPATASFVLASAFEEVWLQPSGTVGLVGASASGVFVRQALEKAHVEPLFSQRHEYKNAADTLVRTEFSPAHREATARLAESAYEVVLKTVAEGRRLAQDQVAALVDRAPLSAAEARAEGLVDQIGYRDAVRMEVNRRGSDKHGKAPQVLFASKYRRRSGVAATVAALRGPVVGLVTAVGPIRQGPSRGPGGRGVGSDTVAAALRSAAADDKVKAVVLRVNSPGGSYVASDTIWREVRRTKESGTPVVVSMGEVAASGGYFISMGADAIVAEPTTLTGSIGVLGGKLALGGLLDHLGVHMEPIAKGRRAAAFSPYTGFDEDDWAALNRWLDEVYRDFTHKVAEGRGLSVDDVDRVARGRVWTGVDARERGLVDETGGVLKALGLARQRASLGPDTPLRPIPAPSPIRTLRPRKNSDEAMTAAGVSSLLASASWSPLARLAAAGAGSWDGFDVVAAAIGLPPLGPLSMPLTPPLR